MIFFDWKMSLAQTLVNLILQENVGSIEQLVSQGYNVNKPQKEFGLVWEPSYQFYKLLNGNVFYGKGFGENMEYGEFIPWTPLQFASILGRDAVIHKLLAKSDLSIKDKAGQSAKDIAKRRCHVSTVEILENFEKFQEKKNENLENKISQIPSDSEEVFNEMNIYKIENTNLKQENQQIKGNLQQVKNETEILKRSQQVYEQMIREPETILLNENKIQELISLQIPLKGVGMFFHNNSFYDKNAAIILGAIATIQDLSNRIEEIFHSESLDSLELKMIYYNVSKLLEKWKNEEFNVPEFDKEMLMNTESIVIQEKIKYFKQNGELFTRKLLELYEHQKLSSKSNNLIFILLDKLSHDYKLQSSILNDLISSWIAGKEDSDLNLICQQISIDMKDLLKQVKSKNTIDVLLPKWYKIKSQLEVILNCKTIISKIE